MPARARSPRRAVALANEMAFGADPGWETSIAGLAPRLSTQPRIMLLMECAAALEFPRAGHEPWICWTMADADVPWMLCV